ncbi:hypothetical protein Bca52824_038814 [Brassica carinata]|uniref:Uncharacterized protein n=1 Tax=Brassica carinata TaxID=52824 RepID=A0A8X7RQ19_BRACI|nr:hypothetical protein Bca52824_038814 [Brassica carinata]
MEETRGSEASELEMTDDRLLTNSRVSGRIMSSRNYVAKDISLGIRPQAAMLEGVFEVAQAVRVTMGPRGVHRVCAGNGHAVPIDALMVIRGANDG